jgi:transcriptional regulator of acetoin/glycerol metabolism
MFSQNGILNPEDLPSEITRVSAVGLPTELTPADYFGMSEGVDSSLHEKRVELERAYLLRLLQDSKGNVTHAALKANMSRQGFHKLLKRHQISAADYRGT